MRVITRFGFGEAESLNQKLIAVVLDKPFLGQAQMSLERSEVFLFSKWAALRVLNIMGYGWFSNLQFHDSRASAEAMLALPTPPDEATFFLDFQTGRFRVNRQLGVLAQSSLIIKPWIDRWADERTKTLNLISEAREAFKTEKKETVGTSEGIGAFLHLDMGGGGNILGFYLVVPPPQGVIFEKEFEFKFHDDS